MGTQKYSGRNRLGGWREDKTWPKQKKKVQLGMKMKNMFTLDKMCLGSSSHMSALSSIPSGPWQVYQNTVITCLIHVRK